MREMRHDGGRAVARRNAASDQKVTRRTRWSLRMFRTFLVAFLVTSFVGEYVMFPWLGLNEGDLMRMDRGAAGWRPRSRSRWYLSPRLSLG